MIGICDDLRKAVLQAAIQGKLTEQLASDGDAETLYSEIQTEKKRLIKEGKIKKEKELEPINLDEVPFDIPDNWKWVRLKDIVYNRGQKTPNGKFSYIDIGSIDNSKQKLSSKENIIEPSTAPSRARKIVEKGDIIYSTVRPYLHNMAIIDKMFSYPPIASTGFAVMTCYCGVNNRYLFYFLLSPDFDKYANDTSNSKGVAYPAINDEKLYRSLIPLPPLAEQHRIVAKVDELMAKIDEMEKTEKSLTDLYNTFPGDMKASLLQAAIQGKLTEQLASDGDAETLYAEIQTEKKRLIKEGKIKKEKELESIDLDDVPFDIPGKWKWVRLSDLGANVKIPFADGPFGSNLKSCHYTNKKEVRIIQLSNIGEDGWKDKNTKYTTYEHLKTIERSSVNAGDIVIAKMMPAGRAICVPNIEKSFVLSSDAVKFVPHPLLEKRYLLYAINSNCFKSQIYEEVQGITRVRTSLQKLKTYLIPLPPLAEQKRIVEKLDQLLSLCDSMKEAIDIKL